jgi:hypothetical protein
MVLQAAKSDTQTRRPAAINTGSHIGKELIQSVNLLEHKDTLLTELNLKVRKVLPPGPASWVIYLIKLAHNSNLVFALFILILWFFLLGLVMGVYLFFAKIKVTRQIRTRNRLEKRYHELIAGFLFQEGIEAEIPAELLSQRSFFQKNILIGLIVKLYIDLEGDVSQRLRGLYLSLGLHKVSLGKVRRGKWFVKIQGFRELANMDVEEAITVIRPYINHTRDELRSEAMISLVRLDKESPFRFLTELSAPFTRWEQLNVFAIARKYQVKIPQFSHWFNHENPTVVMFALTMTGIYQQYDATAEIITLVGHSDAVIRRLAIRLTGELALQGNEAFLRLRYEEETEQENKLEIIRALAKERGKMQTLFFNSVARETGSYALRFAASKALLSHGAESKASFEEIRHADPAAFDPIFNHLNDKRI